MNFERNWIYEEISATDFMVLLMSSGLVESTKARAQCPCGALAMRGAILCARCGLETRWTIERDNGRKASANEAACLDCGNVVTDYRVTRCQPRAILRRHHASGVTCAECGVGLRDYRAKRCRPCSQIVLQLKKQNANPLAQISERIEA